MNFTQETQIGKNFPCSSRVIMTVLSKLAKLIFEINIINGTHTQTYAHTYTHIHTHKHTHIHTHTHTNTH